MPSSAALKCPADFFELGPRAVCLGPNTVRNWKYDRQGSVTNEIIGDCMRLIGQRFYSEEFRERFSEAAGEAIPYVLSRTHPDFPLYVGLFRFANEGQRCVVLTVDSKPLPELRVDLPSPTDPRLTRDGLHPYFAHRYILPRVDGYLVTWDAEVLQLQLSWSEAI